MSDTISTETIVGPMISDTELEQILDEANVLIVHFSTPHGELPESHWYPRDLHHVINGLPEICCSTVSPNDSSDNTLSGITGLILFPITAEAIKAVGPHDLGSIRAGHNVEVLPRYSEVNSKTCRDSIFDRSERDYNEWVLSKYSIRGVFTLGDSIFGELKTRIEAIQRNFPGLRIVTQSDGQFIEVTHDGTINRLNAKTFYKFGQRCN